jgi:hypothetical protein
VIAIGDYYIFGDTQGVIDVRRLIREFSINSKTDLETYLQTNPTSASQYMDVGLRYLPTSLARLLWAISYPSSIQDKRDNFGSL